jgi:hypothetical protein
MRKLVWPIQVRVNCSGVARGITYSGIARVNTLGSGSARRGLRRRSMRDHFRKSRKPCIRADDHGFWNPPPGRWWERCCDSCLPIGYVTTNLGCTPCSGARIPARPRLAAHRQPGTYVGATARTRRSPRLLDLWLNQLRSRSSAVAGGRKAISCRCSGHRSAQRQIYRGARYRPHPGS